MRSETLMQCLGSFRVLLNHSTLFGLANQIQNQRNNPGLQAKPVVEIRMAILPAEICPRHALGPACSRLQEPRNQADTVMRGKQRHWR